jgi:hypothetical protein
MYSVARSTIFKAMRVCLVHGLDVETEDPVAA